jgi:hypothetical protein
MIAHDLDRPERNAAALDRAREPTGAHLFLDEPGRRPEGVGQLIEPIGQRRDLRPGLELEGALQQGQGLGQFGENFGQCRGLDRRGRMILSGITHGASGHRLGAFVFHDRTSSA